MITTIVTIFVCTTIGLGAGLLLFVVGFGVAELKAIKDGSFSHGGIRYMVTAGEPDDAQVKAFSAKVRKSFRHGDFDAEIDRANSRNNQRKGQPS